MYIIGLTGGIASGKSTVSTILRKEFDAFIIDADSLARQITACGTPAYEDIVNKFGHDIIKGDGQIDRKKLGEIVFQNQAARKELEAITHFRIWEEARKLMHSAAGVGAQIAILDAPLLIEAGWQNRVDEIWLVYLDRPTQINRLMQRESLSLTDAEARIESQLSLEEKRKYAKVVIDNSGDFEKTKEQVIFHYRATYSSLEGQKDSQNTNSE